MEITFPYRTVLSQLVDQLRVQAEWMLHLPTTPRREACCARVTLKYARQVPLRRPKNLYKRTCLGHVLPLFSRINVVDLQEILPKGATYQPLNWRIYTSHPIKRTSCCPAGAFCNPVWYILVVHDHVLHACHITGDKNLWVWICRKVPRRHFIG